MGLASGDQATSARNIALRELWVRQRAKRLEALELVNSEERELLAVMNRRMPRWRVHRSMSTGTKFERGQIGGFLSKALVAIVFAHPFGALHMSVATIPQLDVPVGSDNVLAEVLEDLSQMPKRLPHKLFYDTCGSELIERICEQPEYYITRTELGILKENADEIASYFDNVARYSNWEVVLRRRRESCWATSLGTRASVSEAYPNANCA